jgi:hypothetical protein
MSVGNTKYGDGALQKNINGSNNTAFGICSSRDTNNSWNTSVGAYANMSNVSGISNIAIGTNAHLSNISGSYNTALGTATLLNNKSNSNTAVGSNSMEKNTSGKENVAVGVQSGYENTDGEKNVFLGNCSGYNTKGSNNTLIGADTDANGNINNSIAIGSGVKVNASNKIIIGNVSQSTEISGKLVTNDISSNNISLSKGYLSEVINDQRSLINKGYIDDLLQTPIFLTDDHGMTISSGTSKTNTLFGKDVATSGNYNTFIGFQSGKNNSGSYNTCIGHNSKVGNLVTNSTTIGANSIAYESNKIILGTEEQSTTIMGSLTCKNYGCITDIDESNPYCIVNVDYVNNKITEMNGGINGGINGYHYLAGNNLNLDNLTFNLNENLYGINNIITNFIGSTDTDTQETIWLDSGNKNIKVNGITIGSGMSEMSSNILIGKTSENNILGTDNISIGNENKFNEISTNSIAIGNDIIVDENDSNTIILGTNVHTTKISGNLIVSGKLTSSNIGTIVDITLQNNFTIDINGSYKFYYVQSDSVELLLKGTYIFQWVITFRSSFGNSDINPMYIKLGFTSSQIIANNPNDSIPLTVNNSTSDSFKIHYPMTKVTTENYISLNSTLVHDLESDLYPVLFIYLNKTQELTFENNMSQFKATRIK